MQKVVNIKIFSKRLCKKIHFGEPGKGKGPADKYFAIIRAHQRRCIKDSYDADTPKSFADNMCRYGGIGDPKRFIQYYTARVLTIIVFESTFW